MLKTYKKHINLLPFKSPFIPSKTYRLTRAPLSGWLVQRYTNPAKKSDFYQTWIFSNLLKFSTSEKSTSRLVRIAVRMAFVLLYGLHLTNVWIPYDCTESICTIIQILYNCTEYGSYNYTDYTNPYSHLSSWKISANPPLQNFSYSLKIRPAKLFLTAIVWSLAKTWKPKFLLWSPLLTLLYE